MAQIKEQNAKCTEQETTLDNRQSVVLPMRNLAPARVLPASLHSDAMDEEESAEIKYGR